MANLTPKIQRFCEEYIIDLNGKQAAIRAEYSKKTAEQQASRLLSNVKVQKYIAKLQAERAKRTETDADYVINGLKAIADDSDNEKTSDRLKALELIGRHHGVFDKDRFGDDRPQENHVHFHQLTYEEQNRMINMAINTAPLRLSPPNAVQGDGRPTGLKDEDANHTA